MGRLSSAAKRNDTKRMFSSIRNDLAERCDATNSTRDYAAMIKSLIDVTDKLGRLNGDIVDGRKSSSTKSHHTSPNDRPKAEIKKLRVYNTNKNRAVNE